MVITFYVGNHAAEIAEKHFQAVNDAFTEAGLS
jgi:hypothetical protein